MQGRVADLLVLWCHGSGFSVSSLVEGVSCAQSLLHRHVESGGYFENLG